MDVGTKLWVRPGESFVQVLEEDEGNCAVCSGPVVRAKFRWDNWSPDPEALFGDGGDGSFQRSGHADGSPPHGELHTVFAKPRCPECRSEDLSYDESGYGTTARCADCGWYKYSDRGD
ncbi:hypothetical protein GCM10010331_45650 [Streptomyces xanthochromogenes]|nr:hypothetical protein GCM10010331_45650 [Streptomyces xanthochromogenes]